MANYNIFSKENRKYLLILSGLALIIFMIVYILLNPEEPEPIIDNNNISEKPELIYESPEKEIKLYEDVDGSKYVESLDPNRSEKQIKEELGINQNEEIDIYVPGAANSKNYENMIPEEDVWDNERWGLEEDHRDDY